MPAHWNWAYKCQNRNKTTLRYFLQHHCSVCSDSHAPVCQSLAPAVEPLMAIKWSFMPFINWKVDDSADFSLWQKPVAPCIDLSASLMVRPHPLPSKISSDSFKLFNQRLLLLPLSSFLNYLALNLDLSFIHTQSCLGLQPVLGPSIYPADSAHLINECHYILFWASFLMSCSHLALLQAYTSQTL